MPIRNYGVLKGRVIRRIWTENRYEMLIVTQARNRKYRASVNLRSQGFPSELLYYSIPDFEHPITDQLKKMRIGYTKLDSDPDNESLDYIRDNIFTPSRMMIPSFNDYEGKYNDLHYELEEYIKPMLPQKDDKIDYVLKSDDTHPLVFAFGDRWGPIPGEDDRYFQFHPALGVHKIHMNQGNVQQWAYDNGIWQDGGLIFYYPEEDRWSAVFLAFQTQAFHTDDETGKRLLPEPTPENPEPPAKDNIPARTQVPVRIVAALINPVGNDIGKETVVLKNTTDNEISLDGWSLRDKQRRIEPLDGVSLAPGEERTIKLTGYGITLSNRGGIITLVNEHQIKIHGVAYLRSQAYTEGVLVEFKH